MVHILSRRWSRVPCPGDGWWKRFGRLPVYLWAGRWAVWCWTAAPLKWRGTAPPSARASGTRLPPVDEVPPRTWGQQQTHVTKDTGRLSKFFFFLYPQTPAPPPPLSLSRPCGLILPFPQIHQSEHRMTSQQPLHYTIHNARASRYQWLHDLWSDTTNSFTPLRV